MIFACFKFTKIANRFFFRLILPTMLSGSFTNLLCTGGLALFLLNSGLTAQGLFTPTLSNSWQATFSNPALYTQLEGALTVGLPGVSNRLDLGDFTYNDIVVEEGGERILDLNLLADQVSGRNFIGNEFNVETLGFAYHGERFGVGISHRFRSRGQLDFPVRLVEVLANGNAQFIGQTIDIAPYLRATNYHEFALGMSFAASEKVHFGARIKYLSGVADLRINPDQTLLLTTAERGYAITLNQNTVVNTSGAVAYNGFDDFGVDYDFGDAQLDQLFTGNSGLAADIGVFVDLDGIRLQAAVTDLGASINWDEAPQNYVFFGESSFDGLDVLTDLFDDNFSIDGAVDSLLEEFDPTETLNPYSGGVGARFMAAAEVDLTDKWTLAGSFLYSDQLIKDRLGVSAGARYQVLEQWSVGAYYNFWGTDYTNLGVQLYGGIGPLRVLASTDDLLTVFRPRDSSSVGGRVGFAIGF